MKYPCLVPDVVCKTDIHVILYDEGLSETGGPLVVAELNLKCNYQDTGQTVLTADKKLVKLSGVALFTGDICPDFPTICGGIVKVYEIERDIFKGSKARNLDGSVNYCRLELM